MKTMVTLIADEGKVITNGTDYGTTISLAEGLDSSAFYEITREEYNKILEETEDNNNLEVM